MRYLVKAIRGPTEVALLPVEALNEAEASEYTRRQGYEVVSVQRGRGYGLRRLPAGQFFPVIQFTQELIALLKAGLTLVEAIEILYRKEERVLPRSVLSDLLARLRQGMKFSTALESLPALFSPLYTATVRASERTGEIKDALARYIEYQAQVHAVRSKIVSASIYPALLLGVGVLVILFLLAYVVPRFSRVYQDVGERLPLFSKWLMHVGQVVDQHAWLALAGVGSIVAFFYYLYSQQVIRRYISYLVWRMPVLGPQRRVYELAQFYRTMSMLLRSGLPILSALDMAKGMLSATLREHLEVAARQVRNGTAFSDAMSQNQLTTVVAQSMIVVAERSGNLSEMLDVVAAFHEEELSRWVDWFTRLFEPILMAVIGIVIGLIVVFMYMPVFELAETIR